MRAVLVAISETPRWYGQMYTRQVRHYVYSQRTALRTAHKLGFSVRKSRPIPYNGATPKEQAVLIKKARNTAIRWKKEGRMVPAIDAATIRDSPASRRGLRRQRQKGYHSSQPSQKVSSYYRGAGGWHIRHTVPWELEGGQLCGFNYARRRHNKIGIMAGNAKCPHRQHHERLRIRYGWYSRDSAHSDPTHRNQTP